MALEQCVAIRENHETIRELRYALMRFIRGFGWPVFFAFLALLLFGLFYALLSAPDALAQILNWDWGPTAGKQMEIHVGHLQPMTICLSGLTVMAIALVGMAIGDAMKTPYQLVSMMPTTYVRVCHSCGKPLPNVLTIYQCGECKAMFPLGLAAFFIRAANKTITLVHILIWICVAMVFFR